eukprot:1145602-Pelagomonas_calceolata.AAC.2
MVLLVSSAYEDCLQDLKQKSIKRKEGKTMPARALADTHAALREVLGIECRASSPEARFLPYLQLYACGPPPIWRVVYALQASSLRGWQASTPLGKSGMPSLKAQMMIKKRRVLRTQSWPTNPKCLQVQGLWMELICLRL